MIGETIGHFEIVARAGRGGMGEVFVAEHTTIKTRVAIKVLHPHVSANTAHVQRFFNEARAVARIQHAGIVKIFDVGFHASQRAYLIMELLEGETLATRLKRTVRISPRRTAEIARQIASILDATHHAGIIHRDLKPENVFLVHDRELAGGERVKLLDFGIAKLSDTLAGPTTIGAIGTPAYMAPEQWSDSSTVDWRADVYSLGCMLYEMATGRPPFAASSIAEACAKHLNEAPRPLATHIADIPPAIDAFALRLLSKEPARRVGSTQDLERELANLEAAVPPGEEPALMATQEPAAPSLTTLSSAATSAEPRASHRTTAVVASLGLVAIGALVVWRVVGAGDPPSPRPAPPRSASDDDAKYGPTYGSGAAGGSAAAGEAGKARQGSDARAPSPPAGADVLADWLEVANPFVAHGGGRWLDHQVTRREYRRFLESLPVSEALRFQPVTGWDDRDPMRPVAWVTFERATAFCRAIHAGLPTSEQWVAASHGAWGLDPGGAGHPGPLREWTSTVRDGLVVVRGGHERMTPAEQAAAARDPLMKSSEAQAGPDAGPNVVASETIGFRCVR